MSESTLPQLVIGIDTGGTHTDAVLLDYRTREVIATAKTLTTRDDLARGVTDALAKLPIVAPSQVQLVGISSTLATNSIAEGKTRRVALLLVGYDSELVESCGLKERLWTPDFEYFAGGHTASGEEQEPLDEDGIRAWVRSHGRRFDALAISGYFSPLDPSHELRARDVARAELKLPVVLGSELSTQLDSVKRAATASLNASLVAVMSEFVEAVRRALAVRNITAPLMIVKGDGSLMPYTDAVCRPVETVLSGPAASAVGGHFFSSRNDALVIDMGGTTTDIALVENNRVAVSDRGARVGAVETAVPAARVTTVCVGCDSRIGVDASGNTTIGPDRVTPLCRLANSSSSLSADLQRLERIPATSRRPSDFEYWVLAKPIDLDDPRLTNHRHRRLIRLLQQGPRNLSEIFRELEVFHGVQLQVAHLFGQGILEVATVTPTDLLHASGLMKLWNEQAAHRSVRTFAEMLGEDPQRWIEATMDEIVLRIAEEVVVFLGRQHRDLPDRIEGEWARWLVETALARRGGPLGVRLLCPVPLVGIGAPAGVFLRRVADRLDAQFVLPPHHHVANAAGAVAGLVMVTKEAILYPQGESGKHGYRVQVDGRVECFAAAEDARHFAHDIAHAAARSAALAAGAREPHLSAKTCVEGSLQRIVVAAVGAPGVAKISRFAPPPRANSTLPPARERSN